MCPVEGKCCGKKKKKKNLLSMSSHHLQGGPAHFERDLVYYFTFGMQDGWIKRFTRPVECCGGKKKAFVVLTVMLTIFSHTIFIFPIDF